MDPDQGVLMIFRVNDHFFVVNFEFKFDSLYHILIIIRADGKKDIQKTSEKALKLI